MVRVKVHLPNEISALSFLSGGAYNGQPMARRFTTDPDEQIAGFLQECQELRRIVQGAPLSVQEYQIIRAHLDALLADLDMSIKREEQSH